MISLFKMAVLEMSFNEFDSFNGLGLVQKLTELSRQNQRLRMMGGKALPCYACQWCQKITPDVPMHLWYDIYCIVYIYDVGFFRGFEDFRTCLPCLREMGEID